MAPSTQCSTRDEKDLILFYTWAVKKHGLDKRPVLDLASTHYKLAYLLAAFAELRNVKEGNGFMKGTATLATLCHRYTWDVFLLIDPAIATPSL